MWKIAQAAAVEELDSIQPPKFLSFVNNEHKRKRQKTLNNQDVFH